MPRALRLVSLVVLGSLRPLLWLWREGPVQVCRQRGDGTIRDEAARGERRALGWGGEGLFCKFYHICMFTHIHKSCSGLWVEV